ncbi:MAG: pullulanase [Paenibacillus sp.]|uniref:DUF6509 family protein n=1 Tax=Paenibacillus aquistagni TaxID=1852522 RepID=UPI000B50B972|nr:DUF6509 family protein [Paenibacillus aquistagni]MBR2568972.1 pullulanase [Paenibacillus sp.]
MLTITGCEAEQVRDPFGILSGIRYECKVMIEVPEEDELYLENGVYARVIYCVDGEQAGIVKYDLHERFTERYLDVELEEDELAQIDACCLEHVRSEQISD